jgi:hypothetical protein
MYIFTLCYRARFGWKLSVKVVFIFSYKTSILVCARNYRPCFRENKPKVSFSIKKKRAFWACFRENWVYKFGHWCGLKQAENKSKTTHVSDLRLSLCQNDRFQKRTYSACFQAKSLGSESKFRRFLNLKICRHRRRIKSPFSREDPYA